MSARLCVYVWATLGDRGVYLSIWLTQINVDFWLEMCLALARGSFDLSDYKPHSA